MRVPLGLGHLRLYPQLALLVFLRNLHMERWLNRGLWAGIWAGIHYGKIVWSVSKILAGPTGRTRARICPENNSIGGGPTIFNGYGM